MFSPGGFAGDFRSQGLVRVWIRSYHPEDQIAKDAYPVTQAYQHEAKAHDGRVYSQVFCDSATYSAYHRIGSTPVKPLHCAYLTSALNRFFFVPLYEHALLAWARWKTHGLKESLERTSDTLTFSITMQVPSGLYPVIAREMDLDMSKSPRIHIPRESPSVGARGYG